MSSTLARSRRWISTVYSAHEKLTRLRNAMAAGPQIVDAYIIPSEDAHQSEYTADCDNRRAWISGFTGSAGRAIVTGDKAALFTDGRYFLQAEQQLDSTSWELIRQGEPGVPTWQEYLATQLPRKSRVGVYPPVISVGEATRLEKDLAAVDSTLEATPCLVDQIRADQSSRPSRPIKIHPTKYAGKSHQEKIKDVTQHLVQHQYDGTILSALDEIAWLLNLRGSDIHCCPVFFAYCTVTPLQTILYTHQQGFSKEITDYLSMADVQVRPYECVFDDIRTLPGRFVVDPDTTSLAILEAIGRERTSFEPSILPRAKAIKNTAELNGVRTCHHRDGAALAKHFAWLERALSNQECLHEQDAVVHLEAMRQEYPEYIGPSFDTIAATGPNAAIIHYSPSKTSSAVIDPNQLYLCDSGAHYIDGTTDVTRTYLFGENVDHRQQTLFTRVLSSHIALDQAVFPEGTTGYQLDSIARAPMWKHGMDFRHGTGHGVGAYLNVHEGPHGIGRRPSYDKHPLEPGMLVTNEPGYYEDGCLGIRIENVLITRLVDTPVRFGDRGYFGFEHVTFVPLGRRLIRTDLLSLEERAWVNQYHQKCRTVLEPYLVGDSLAQQWVERETEPL